MGLLDSNIVRFNSKSLNISGAATTAYSYINGGSGIFSVEKYATICFQVKAMTAGVQIVLYGGVTSGYQSRLVHKTNGEVTMYIDSTGTYYADVSTLKSAGFYITKAAENGTVDIDIVLKSTPIADTHGVIQTLITETFTMGAGNLNKDLVISNGGLARHFKFIIVFAKYTNSSNTAVTKDNMYVSTYGSFEGNYSPAVEHKKVLSASSIVTDWIPLYSESDTVRVGFSGASAAGDKLLVVVKGIR